MTASRTASFDKPLNDYIWERFDTFCRRLFSGPNDYNGSKRASNIECSIGVNKEKSTSHAV